MVCRCLHSLKAPRRTDNLLERTAVGLNDVVKSISTPFVDSPEQLFPAASDFDVRLVQTPERRTITLLPADLLLQFRGVAMNPAHDRGWVQLHSTLHHHLRQIAVKDPVLAIAANAYQEISEPEISGA